MPLTEKGRKIMEHMKEEYGPEKGERVFYASRNAGTIKGVEKTNDVPEVSYRSSLPSGASVKQLNEANRRFWAGNAGVGTSPSESDGQGNNFTPGERKLPVNNQAMLTPPIEASRFDNPWENLFESSAGTEAGDEYKPELMTVSMRPHINHSNFNPKAGLMGVTGSNGGPMDSNFNRDAGSAKGSVRDDKEDQLFPESDPGPMGFGQSPYKYLEPKAVPPPSAGERGGRSPDYGNQPVKEQVEIAGPAYTTVIGTGQHPTRTPGIAPPASLSGRRPGEVTRAEKEFIPQYKQAGNKTLTDVKKRIEEYWSKNLQFKGRGEKK